MSFRASTAPSHTSPALVERPFLSSLNVCGGIMEIYTVGETLDRLRSEYGFLSQQGQYPEDPRARLMESAIQHITRLLREKAADQSSLQSIPVRSGIHAKD